MRREVQKSARRETIIVSVEMDKEAYLEILSSYKDIWGRGKNFNLGTNISCMTLIREILKVMEDDCLKWRRLYGIND